MKDLFGVEIVERPAKAERAKHKTLPAGYAAPPGTGPYGETCKTCCHKAANHQAKVYWKCAKIRHLWTGGLGTDIRLKSPACRLWEKADPSEPIQEATP